MGTEQGQEFLFRAKGLRSSKFFPRDGLLQRREIEGSGCAPACSLFTSTSGNWGRGEKGSWEGKMESLEWSFLDDCFGRSRRVKATSTCVFLREKLSFCWGKFRNSFAVISRVSVSSVQQNAYRIRILQKSQTDPVCGPANWAKLRSPFRLSNPHKVPSVLPTSTHMPRSLGFRREWSRSHFVESYRTVAAVLIHSSPMWWLLSWLALKSQGRGERSLLYSKHVVFLFQHDERAAAPTNGRLWRSHFFAFFLYQLPAKPFLLPSLLPSSVAFLLAI